MIQKNSGSFVIAISGPSGGGKSTVARRTAESLGGAVMVEFDDYGRNAGWPSSEQFLERGASPNLYPTPQMGRDLAALKGGQAVTLPDGREVGPTEFIVITDPFGRGRDDTKEYIDFVALIDTPFDVALSRKIFRTVGVARERPPDLAEALRMIENAADCYTGSNRRVYQIANECASRDCDLVLDGTKSVEEIVGELVSAVHSRRPATPTTRPRSG